ncbi:hypothetical protein [Stenotrophomonas panacihumi]|uniref:hypothetical protein n=1 Tax=Stenotrophomonas panacihumi TaxID=676599 RepID=UPI0011B298B7|nr:hypothetical protein [Stenotrophomonas panacihumi]
MQPPRSRLNASLHSFNQLDHDLSTFQCQGSEAEKIETAATAPRTRDQRTITPPNGHDPVSKSFTTLILEKRSIEGRHDGSEFSVEVWLREGSEAFIHRVDVDRIPVPAGHLPVCMGMNAALDLGCHLARDFIDAKHL